MGVPHAPKGGWEEAFKVCSFPFRILLLGRLSKPGWQVDDGSVDAHGSDAGGNAEREHALPGLQHIQRGLHVEEEHGIGRPLHEPPFLGHGWDGDGANCVPLPGLSPTKGEGGGRICEV